MNKLIVGFVLLGAVVLVKGDLNLTDEQKSKIQAYGRECVEETGVDRELIQKAREGKFTEDAMLKAFAFCMSRKTGFQNDAGDIQADVIRSKLRGDMAEKLIKQCLKNQSSKEETAYQVFKCYYENTPQHLAIF